MKSFTSPYPNHILKIKKADDLEGFGDGINFTIIHSDREPVTMNLRDNQLEKFVKTLKKVVTSKRKKVTTSVKEI